MALIVVADDELDLLELLAELLREDGHTVWIAADGRDALRLIREHRPHLAILDLDMPLLSGTAVMAELRAGDVELAETPVILFSGNAEVAVIAAETGAVDYLSKPVGVDDLTGSIHRALSARRGTARA